MSDVAKAGAFWDREIVEKTHGDWMSEPPIRAYLDASIGGAATPMAAGDWFVANFGGRTFARGLSIGCGVGNLEREAIRRNVCARIDALDGSLGALRVARTAADAEGYGNRIRYFAADFNRPVLPRNAYDIVFFNQSLHHVAELERLLAEVLRAMTPGAILYVDEYIGPSRTDWNDALIAPQRAFFAALPPELRRSEFLPLPIQADDPSEAVRSGEIVEQLRVGFRFEALRGYGGNLIAVLFPLLHWERMTDEQKRGLIEADRTLAARGPYYALIVARPARGLRRLWALARWSFAARRRGRARVS